MIPKSTPASGHAKAKAARADREGPNGGDSSAMRVPPLIGRSIPPTLRKLPRWVGWRYVQVPGKPKPDKVPFSTSARPRKIDATKIANGVSFPDALTASRDKAKNLDGIGFVLGNGLAGIDVDDCIDENGVLDAHGRRFSEQFRETYGEISPSGRGVKFIVDIGDDAQLGAVHINTHEHEDEALRRIELYGSKRYFTTTGNRLPDHPLSIAHMPDAFRALAAEVGALGRALVDQPGDASSATGSGRWVHRTSHTRKQVQAALDIISADCSNETWFKYGCAIELQVGDEGFAIWNQWSATVPNAYAGENKCRREWARFKRYNDALTEGDAPTTVATVIADAQRVGARKSKQASAPARPAIVKYQARSLKDEDVGEVEVLIPGMLTAGLSLLSGQPKLGKSWLMLKLLLQMAQGSPVWGRPVEKTKSLYLALEDSKRRMKLRMAKLTHDYMLDDPDFEYVLEAPRLDEGLADWLSDQVQEHGYKLIVIDTLARVRPLQTRSTHIWQTDYDGVQQLKAIADELNVAIVVITHNSKAGSNGFAAQNAIAATGGLMAGVDGWWVLEHTGKLTVEGELVVKLTVEHRDVEGGEFALVFDKTDAVWRMLGPFNETTVGDVQRLIRDALQRAGDGGMRLSDLMSAIDHSKTSVSNALIRMRKSGLVATDPSSVNRLATK